MKVHTNDVKVLFCLLAQLKSARTSAPLRPQA
jgi:hypothetical protein